MMFKAAGAAHPAKAPSPRELAADARTLTEGVIPVHNASGPPQGQALSRAAQGDSQAIAPACLAVPNLKPTIVCCDLWPPGTLTDDKMAAYRRLIDLGDIRIRRVIHHKTTGYTTVDYSGH